MQEITEFENISKEAQDAIQDINWEELMYVTNGTDATGMPLASAMLTVDEIISSEQLNTISNVLLREAVINIHCSGGCAVITADLPASGGYEFKQASGICIGWFSDIDNPEHDNWLLSLVITPLLLEGNLTFQYHQLVFFDGYQYENGYRLTFAFDNEQSRHVFNNTIDFRRIIAEIEDEIKAEEDAMNESIAQAKEIENAAKENNPYSRAVKETFSATKEDNAMDDEYTGKNIRSVEEISGVRVREDADENRL